MKTSVGVALVIAGTMGILGCGDSDGDGGGGGGSMGSVPTASSGSFSPSTATTATGDPVTELWWRYRMNGGAAVSVSVNGTPGTLTVGERLTRLIDGGTRRLTTFPLTLTLNNGTGPVTSKASNTIEETLMAGPPSATVKQVIMQTQEVTNMGLALHLAVQTAGVPSMPLVDFGDRTDLDQLPLGHADEVTVTTTVTSVATATSPADPETTTVVVDLTSTDHNVWTIKEQLPSLTVLGKTYDRVVKMEVAGDSTNTSTGEVATQTNIYWLAAGVGVIKAITNSTAPVPFTAELIDTNLGL